MNRYRVALVALAVAVLAAGVSLYSLSRVTTVEIVDAPTAKIRFETALDAFDATKVLLQRAADGAWVRSTENGGPPAGKLRRIGVLAYEPDNEKLYRMDIPFWFYRMKGPALGFVLKDTGFDLGDLGIQPLDLQEHGPGLVLDEEQADSGRIVVWVE